MEPHQIGNTFWIIRYILVPSQQQHNNNIGKLQNVFTKDYENHITTGIYKLSVSVEN